MISVVNKLLEPPMTDLRELVEMDALLENSGYRYHLMRMIYFNRAMRRAFSLRFLETHSKQELQRLVEMPATGDWVIHFNEPPTGRDRQNLIEAFSK